MKHTDKIYIAGHRGLAGSGFYRELQARGFNNIVTATSKQLDLRNQVDANAFIAQEKPDVMIISAAKVGGILANKTYPAEFIYDNLMIQCNLIHAAYVNNVKELLFLGSSCIYPKLSQTPITEDQLLGGHLEPTNDAYAIAKIAGLKMCEAYNKEYGTRFVSVMPCNLYGPGDNYDLQNSHVLPALIRKFHEAKRDNTESVTLWGTGEPRREFMYVDDFVKASLLVLEQYEGLETVNIGTGTELPIRELAENIRDVVGFQGPIQWDTSKPDGTFSKVLDVSKLKALGFKAEYDLKHGIQLAYQDYLSRFEQNKAFEAVYQVETKSDSRTV